MDYFSGGSGYVLSHAAVKKIVEDGLGSELVCHLPYPVGQEVTENPNEDLQMGKCAAILNIHFESSEVRGRSTFLPFPIDEHLVPDLNNKWWENHTLECKDVNGCVSSDLVSMHYVTPRMMYVYEYFVYGFKRSK